VLMLSTVEPLSTTKTEILSSSKSVDHLTY
jgi:hypothetical protein